MKTLTKLLTLLLALTTLLTACGSTNSKTAAPSEPQAAVTESPSNTELPASEAPTESQLTSFQVTLPEGMIRQISSETSDSLIVDGKVVGGILILDVSRACVEDPGSSGELEYYLHNTVMPQIDPRDGYDYMMDWGALSLVAAHATFATQDRIEYSHHICLGPDAVYDFWVNRSLVDSDTENAMVESIAIPE